MQFRFTSSSSGKTKSDAKEKVKTPNFPTSNNKPPLNPFLSKETKNQIEAISKQAKSIPNIITFSRIASTPILCHFVITQQFDIAIIGCFIAGVSDYLDGYIAKNYNQQTVLGTYLDPLADKILINTIALSLSYVDILPLWSSLLWLGRDVVLVGMSYQMAAVAAKGRGHAVADPARTPLKVMPTLISKVNTTLQFGTIGIGLCVGYMGSIDVINLNMIGLNYDLGIMEGLSYMTGITTIWSALSYVDGKAMAQSGNRNSLRKK